MAIGFDIEAAEVTLKLRQELHGIKVVAVIPFEGMQRGFAESWRSRFNHITQNADEVITLAPKYSSEVYAIRNNFLVDNSSTIIAYFTGEKGGTAYTINRAVKGLLRIKNIYHNPQGELF